MNFSTRISGCAIVRGGTGDSPESFVNRSGEPNTQKCKSPPGGGPVTPAEAEESRSGKSDLP
jgi:hypothetical protein